MLNAGAQVEPLGEEFWVGPPGLVGCCVVGRRYALVDLVDPEVKFSVYHYVIMTYLESYHLVVQRPASAMSGIVPTARLLSHLPTQPQSMVSLVEGVPASWLAAESQAEDLHCVNRNTQLEELDLFQQGHPCFESFQSNCFGRQCI